eukprot:1777706-Amphidinium_carterae.1
MLRSDKKLWFSKLCENSQEFFAHRETGKAFRIIKQLGKSKRRRTGNSLALLDGTVSHEPEVVAEQWLQHWQRHFRADCVFETGFSNRSFPQLGPRGSGGEFYTSQEEVLALLKTMNMGSTAPDLCPHRYRRFLEPHLSNALTASFNACMDNGTVPTAWSGSIIIPVCKPGKSTLVKESHRPIQLMLMEAKIFSRILLKHLAHFVAVSWLQFARGGVYPPLIAQQQFVAHARDRKLSAGLIFVDVASAFDDVAHNLLFAPEHTEQRDDLIFNGMRRVGLDHAEATSAQQYIRSYPHHILSDAVPPKLLQVLKQWVVSPWFQLPQHHTHADVDPQPSVLIKTQQGIRQGDCLSSYLFCVFFESALRDIHDFIVQNTEEITFSKAGNVEEHRSMCTILGEDRDRGHPFRLTLLAYADDILIPVAASKAAKLVKQIQQLMSFLWETFKKYQLRINCGPRKTEVCMHLESRDAKPILQFLRTQTIDHYAAAHPEPTQTHTGDNKGDETPILIPFDEGWVRVVKSYHYLGRWASMSTNPCQDFSVQRACAINAFHQHQRVLTATKYSLATRLYLFRTLVRGHLVQNVPTYSEWPTRSVSAMNRTYILLLKKVVLVANDPMFFHLPEADFLAYVGEPSLLQLFDRRVAMFIPRICDTPFTQVRAALENTTKRSLWATWIPVLTRMRSSLNELGAMPIPTILNFPDWLTLMTVAGPRWKLLVRQATAGLNKPNADFGKLYILHATNIVPPPLLEVGDVEEPDEEKLPADDSLVACPYCEQKCQPGRGLLAHKLKTHQIVPPMALRTRSTTCSACGSQLGTRARVLDHLRKKLSCALWTLHHSEPMSWTEYQESVSRLNDVDELQQRVLPKTGPIPLVQGKYESQSVIPINPFNEFEIGLFFVAYFTEALAAQLCNPRDLRSLVSWKRHNKEHCGVERARLPRLATLTDSGSLWSSSMCLAYLAVQELRESAPSFSARATVALDLPERKRDHHTTFGDKASVPRQFLNICANGNKRCFYVGLFSKEKTLES